MTSNDLSLSICKQNFRVLRKRQFGPMNSLQAAEIFVRQIQSQPITTQQPIAILGNADAGKSTLVGVITTGELDNGKELFNRT